MMHASGLRLAVRDRGAKRCRCQPGVDGSPEGIADDAPRPGIEDDSEVNEASRYGDEGQVGNPQLVRTGWDQLPARLGKIGPP